MRRSHERGTRKGTNVSFVAHQDELLHRQYAVPVNVNDIEHIIERLGKHQGNP